MIDSNHHNYDNVHREFEYHQARRLASHEALSPPVKLEYLNNIKDFPQILNIRE